MALLSSYCMPGTILNSGRYSSKQVDLVDHGREFRFYSKGKWRSLKDFKQVSDIVQVIF